MGRFPIIQVLLGTVLLGGVALAQQGLIIEPWRRSASPPAAVAVPARDLPASGLPGRAASRPVAQSQSAPPLLEPAAPSRWSPPVVELLVDPWAKERVAAPPARLRWVPSSVEIINPWADEPATPPRVASRIITPERATIF